MSNQYIYGFHAIESLILINPKSIKQLFIQENSSNPRLKKILEQVSNKIKVQVLNKQELIDLVSTEKNQGIVALISEQAVAQATVEEILQKKPNPWFLVLDEVSDPHNLGACLRSCAATGVDAVIVPKQNSASLNQVSIKVASGAASVVPVIRVTNLARTLRLLQDNFIKIFGTAGEAETNIYQLDLSKEVSKNQGLALVMGNEGKGLRRLTREHCDKLIQIPMVEGPVSSLNVSVATGVALFEFYRQLVILAE